MICPPRTVAHYLDANHYLGATGRGFAWSDEDGVLVLAAPTSRRLPTTWLELTRWCLVGNPNGGSRQWSAVRRWLREHRPEVTTIVSYSDPAAGHTGALYRACGWLWAPTWHRLRPPPTGQGAWSNGKIEAPKDRWVDCLAPDNDRARILAVQDDSIVRAHPEWSFREPSYRRGRVVRGSGGADFAAFAAELA
jgi:hypothetical protein